MTTRSTSRPSQRGFTLLEVMLALGLAGIVLFLISVAVRTNLRAIDSGRSSVEEAQLARAVLNMIADDLRATVRYTPPDTEGLAALAANMQLSAQEINSAISAATGGESGAGTDESGQGGDSPGGQGSGGNNDSSSGQGANNSGGSSGRGSGSGSSSSGSSSGQGSSNSSGGSGGSGEGGFGAPSSGSAGDAAPGDEGLSLSEDEAAVAVPGIFGNLYELQIDMVRAPRPDQQMMMVNAAEGGMIAASSGVQRVRYYVDVAGAPSAAGVVGTVSRGGLVRREVDRSIAGYAASGGITEAPGELVQEIAPEVASVEFRYFDGYSWYEEWSSTEQAPLPLAIEIAVAIAPRTAETEDPSVVVPPGTGPDLTNANVYRLVVQLPTAEIGEEATTSSSSSETSTPADGSMPQQSLQGEI